MHIHTYGLYTVMFQKGQCFLKELIVLFCKAALNWLKVTVKIFIKLQKNYNSNKLLFSTFYSTKNLEKKNIIRIVYNTDKCEDWRNDAE